MRLIAGFQDDAPAGPAASDGPLLDALRLVGQAGLVATIEATADQLERITTLATALPELRIVLDHFGWPTDLGPAGRDAHLEALRLLAARPNVATRLDALGTIFGAWDVATVRPWLEGVVDLFGCDRCMVGSDLPIETLRSSFAELCGAYDEIFRSRSRRSGTSSSTTRRCAGSLRDRPSSRRAGRPLTTKSSIVALDIDTKKVHDEVRLAPSAWGTDGPRGGERSMLIGRMTASIHSEYQTRRHA